MPRSGGGGCAVELAVALTQAFEHEDVVAASYHDRWMYRRAGGLTRVCPGGSLPP
jgi:hypothetical protein